jgi:hypothetical protein
MVDHEPGDRSQARRAEPGAVAVAGRHQQVGVLAGLDDQPLDPALAALVAGRATEPGLAGGQQLGRGLAGQRGHPGRRRGGRPQRPCRPTPPRRGRGDLPAPQVTITTQATSIPIPGFDDITLGRLTLLRTVEPADTAVVDQVCQAVDDLANQPGKRKGKRLAEAADALNALGGTWQLAPVEPPTTG